MVRLRDLWKWLKAEFNWRILGRRYEVIMNEETQRQFDELPEYVQEEIRKSMEEISRNPYSMESVDIHSVKINSDDVPEAPKVHCEKEDRMVPIWWCLGSFMQGKKPCPELLHAVYDGPNNRATVKCKAQKGVDEDA